MFLTAVLQGHTDSQSQSDRVNEVPETAQTVQLPARLEKSLAVPMQERAQPLPSVHRSRWI